MPLDHTSQAETEAVRPNRTYTALLIVRAFVFAMSVGSTWFVLRLPSRQSDPAVDLVLRYVIFINACYLAAIVLTLAMRVLAPAAGRVATIALNLILLLAIPLRTAVGLYGLWKVDRSDAPRRA